MNRALALPATLLPVLLMTGCAGDAAAPKVDYGPLTSDARALAVALDISADPLPERLDAAALDALDVDLLVEGVRVTAWQANEGKANEDEGAGGDATRYQFCLAAGADGPWVAYSHGDGVTDSGPSGDCPLATETPAEAPEPGASTDQVGKAADAAEKALADYQAKTGGYPASLTALDLPLPDGVALRSYTTDGVASYSLCVQAERPEQGPWDYRTTSDGLTADAAASGRCPA